MAKALGSVCDAGQFMERVLFLNIAFGRLSVAMKSKLTCKDEWVYNYSGMGRSPISTRYSLSV